MTTGAKIVFCHLVLLLVIPAQGIFGNDVFIGEHKLCDGMELKKRQKPAFDLQYLHATETLFLSGNFDIGIESAVKEKLKLYPDITGIILESEGGNVYQGRGVARIIEKHNLKTYIFSKCYSACSIAFIAGSERYASTNAELGFHGYRLESMQVSPNLDIEEEQQKDFTFFSRHIDSPEFLANIFSANCKSIWIPAFADLVEANIVTSK